jgi:hypothetical protein
MLEITFSIIYATLFVTTVTVELIGVKRKAAGDTITENWRFIDKWLHYRSPIIDFLWRVFTAGFLVWLLLHFLVRL